MDFTRQPIIESVITAKEGCKLVVRSSKGAGQEEYFVDAVEVVSFGHSLFFRSLEKPKSFLAPASDYEVLEVREARMVLKHVGADRSTIRIGGGREASHRPAKEVEKAAVHEEGEGAAPADARLEKRRDRRRSVRRRRGQEGSVVEGDTPMEESSAEAGALPSGEEHASGAESVRTESPEQKRQQRRSNRSAPVDMSNPMLTSLLPPPPNLISETIDRYKENEMFRGAFFTKGEEGKTGGVPTVPLTPPQYGSYEMTEEEEEEVYQKRLRTIEEEAQAQKEFAKQQGNQEESWEVAPEQQTVEPEATQEESETNRLES